MELNQDNYENYLLLYIDNELSASEKAAVELLLASNPKLAQTLKALQAVQLKPEFVEFSDKSSLYRFDEMNASLDPAFKKTLYKSSLKSAKLIDIKKIYWATGSIAAIAFSIFFGVKTLVNQPQIQQPQLVASIAPIKNNIPNKSVSILKPIEKTLSTTDNQLNNQPQIIAQSNQVIADATLPIIASVTNNDQPILSKETLNGDQTATMVESSVISVDNTTMNSTIAVEQKIEKEIFEEINTEDNDRVIYISNIELDGDKFRGITRRLNALFKRNKSEKNK
jgi:hypothetical protein